MTNETMTYPKNTLNQATQLNPLVSIIVIIYNSSKYVLETLESARAQTYKNIELIVSDDCSTDDTVEVCRQWIEENKERFVNTELITVPENTGIPANCNRGVRAAKGEWVKIIAGDDLLFNNSIENNLNFIRYNYPKQIEVLHSNVQLFVDTLVEDNFKPIKELKNLTFNTCSSSETQHEILLRHNPVYAATVLLNREIFKKYGFFDEKYRIWEDRSMWLKLTFNGVYFYYFDQITVYYRESSFSVQKKRNINKIFAEYNIERDKYMLDFIHFMPFFERKIRYMEYNRKYILDKLGLNKINLFCRGVNFLTGYLLSKIISFYNNKYLK